MRFLIYRWQAYNQTALEDALIQIGHDVDVFSCDITNPESDQCFEEKLERYLADNRDADVRYDAVVSINYFPVIAKSCFRQQMKYISWTCDSPMLTLYTKSAKFNTNYIFVFDKMVYCEMKARGIEHIWHVPLGVDVCRNDNVIGMANRHRYDADVSFVGSLYEKNRYDDMVNMPDYIKGYFDALINVQMETYGDNFLERMIPEEIERQLDGAAVDISGDEFTGTPSFIVANTALGMKLANVERTKILNKVSKHIRDCKVYTGSDTSDIPLVHNMGKVDYLTQMPCVFHDTKINLNITLRNIKTGIPLRIWDIMGAGGFVLTNYQAELPEYFKQGKHLVWYESHDDMMQKICYYLAHEDERVEIARAGYELVKSKHTMQERVSEILSYLD